MPTLYVSPSGSDRNPGTKVAPLQNLSAARDRVRSLLESAAEDVVVRLAPGLHCLQETLVLGMEDGGDGRIQVIWEGSADGKTILSSGVPLTGWKRCEEDLPDVSESLRGRVWVADLPAGSEVNSVYGSKGSLPRAKGKAIQPVMTPSSQVEGATGRYGPDGPITRNIHSETAEGIWHHDQFGFAEGALTPASDLQGAEFLLIPAMQWTMNILSIAEVDFDQRIVKLANPCTYPIGIPHCAPEGSIWLENSLSVLSPGHWVYHANTSKLYYCPEDEEPEPDLMAGSLVEYIRIEGAVEPDGIQQPVQGIQLRNLTFTHSNRFPFHGLTGKGIQHDWEMHDAATCMVRLRHAKNCAVENCSFTEGGSGGLRMDLSCRDNRVEACEFCNLGGCGIVLCGYGPSRHYLNRNNRIIHNHLHHLGRAYWHSPAIFIWQSGENEVSDNHIHDLPYTGIVCSGRILYDREGNGECSRTIDWQAVEEQCGKGYVQNPWYYSGLPSWWEREPLMHSRDNLIQYNLIHDVMQVMGDGNGIYVSGAGGGNVVRFNVVGPCPSPHMAEGLRCDDDQHHTILHGNLIYQQGGRATGITLKGINRVTNNIIATPLTTPVRGFLSLETGPLNGSVIQRNIFLSTAPDQCLVNDLRIHGQGRKARLRDTESDFNIYWCLGDPEAGPRFLADAQSYGTDAWSKAVDPGCMDPVQHDFRLKPDAPAKQTGFQELPLERMFASKNFHSASESKDKSL
jgi:hypothetical protein